MCVGGPPKPPPLPPPRPTFNGKLNILTIIPGYMSTKPFKENAPQFLITTPEKTAKNVGQA